MFGWWTDLRVAAGLLARLPLPPPPAGADFTRATRAYPLVGAALGAGAGGVLWIAGLAGLPALAGGFLAVGALILLTGALHEDGLADLADGLGARGDRDARLAAMRDSRIGAFGVLALILAVGLQAALLAGAPRGVGALLLLVAVQALSRAPLAALMHALPPARSDGLSHATGRPTRAQALAGAGVGVAIAMGCLGPVPGLLLAGAAALGAGLVGTLARSRLGGQTGDVLGAAQQVAALLALLVGVALAAPPPPWFGGSPWPG